MPLRAARDGDAGFAVETEEFEDVLSLRPAQQPLEAGGVFEPLFEGFLALVGIAGRGFAFEPGALLLGVEELPEAFRLARARTHPSPFPGRAGARLPYSPLPGREGLGVGRT